MKLNRKGNRIYLNACWYMIQDNNGEYRVYDDGEYEGRYCGSLKSLEAMTEDEALKYIFSAL